MVVLKPNVVKGGRAIGLGNNLYLMKGRTHSKGGIDIGKNPKTGLEVENNEVMQVSPQGVRVFSAQPILGGISPAQYILGGANPNQVFNAQEQWKKVNRINDDGTRKARFGTEEDSKRDSSQVNIFRPNQDNSKVQANRIAHRKSLEKFIKDNPNLYGINTADFIDFMLDNATMESNNSATAKHGSMYGYYQLKGLKQGSTEEQQHKAAYKHLSNLFKNVITDADISKAKELGISQAQLLHKLWNQERKVLNYLYQGKDSEDGLGTKISEWGNNNSLEIDYSPYVMKAINDRNYIIQKGDNPESIMKRYRGIGNETRTFNDYNKDAANILGLDYSKPLRIGQELSVDVIGPRKKNGSFRYGGRKIAKDGIERSRKKIFSNVTERIKQIAKQEKNRNTPLPIRGEKPITPLGYDIASYAPIVGDAIQLGEGVSDIKNKNYIAGAINLGLLALPNAIQGPVKKGIQSAVRKYEIKHFPGYQLKSLMEGNPLEKQLSKDGTISVNSIKAISNKGSKVEKSVIDKVLDTKYAGKKSIDYNDFRKSIQDELITYDRISNINYQKYGAERLGLRVDETNLAGNISNMKDYHSKLKMLEEYGSEEEKMTLKNIVHDIRSGNITESEYDKQFDKLYDKMRRRYTDNDIPLYDTYTFSSSRIPLGSNKHYSENTLGHSRTYTTADEPDVLHVMESQSDWAQEGRVAKNAAYVKDRIGKHPGTESDPDSWLSYAKDRVKAREEEVESFKKMLETGTSEIGEKLEPYAIKQIKDELLPASEKRLMEAKSRFYGPTPQEFYLSDNYTIRQIQENLRYAAEKGQSKMRYPTRETAAKIENYPEVEMYIDERGIKHDTPYEYDQDIKAKLDAVQRRFDEISRSINESDMPEYERLASELSKLSDAYINSAVPIKNAKKILSYAKEHEGILKKYDAFPKQFKKLYKDADVRTITDSKGNTWYEVDVPKDYLNQEWQYKYGGIHIKPSKRGTFTAAAKKHGMSVQGFASKVLANKGKYSSAMVKKANFAKSASKWKHKEFGGDMDFNYYITKDNIYKLGGRKKALNGTDYLKLLWNEDSNIPTVKFSGLNVNIPTINTLSYQTRNNRARNNTSIPNPTEEQVKQLMMDDIGLGISNRSQSIVNDALKNNSRLSEPSLQNTINRMDAVRTIASNQPTVKINNSGLVAQNLANGIQAGINIAGNIGSYLINRDAIRKMRGPAAPLPLRAETLPTRVSTSAQEAALRENVAKQENLLAGNLSSSRSRLNATNQIRNQGIGLYNQLQERKGEIERELITRDKLNRQGITNQNIAQVNQWRNASREFENKRIDLNSENTIQHLIQGPADAIAGERGFFDNLASNDRYRMTAFLEAIKNPDALRAMNSDEIKQLARRFGVRTSWLRSIGINI